MTTSAKDDNFFETDDNFHEIDGMTRAPRYIYIQ